MSREQNNETKRDEAPGITPERRKRINRLKKMIVWTVFLMILLPFTGCVLLGIKLYQKNKSMEVMAERIGFLERALQDSVDEKDRLEALLGVNGEIWQEREAEEAVGFLADPGEVSGNDIMAEDVSSNDA